MLPDGAGSAARTRTASRGARADPVTVVVALVVIGMTVRPCWLMLVLAAGAELELEDVDDTGLLAELVEALVLVEEEFANVLLDCVVLDLLDAVD